MIAGASWLCHSCSSDDSVEDRNHEQHCKQVISGRKIDFVIFQDR